MNRYITPPLFLTYSFLVFFLLALSGAKAADNRPEVERLIASSQWSQAARQVYLQARDVYKYESSIAVGQAKSGYFDDALETIELNQPSARAYKLISALRAAPYISEAERLKLVEKAVVYAKERPTHKARNYLLSSDLTTISRYYLFLGLEKNSRILFNEALFAAENGLKEEGRGYQGITGQLYRADHKEVRGWMLDPLQQHLSKAHSPEPNAYACINMISVSQRFAGQNLATPFIECASDSIARIDKTSKKKRLLSKLSEEKVKFGLVHSEGQVTPRIKALQHARAGNLAKAYSVISSMKGGFYVDHKWTLYEEVFSDAIKRGDLNAAIYLAKRPVRKSNPRSLAIWQRVAEKQIENGNPKAAYSSYKNEAALLSHLESLSSASDITIKMVCSFGESMAMNNMINEGTRVIRVAQSLQSKIPVKRQDYRVEASLHIAKAMLRLDMAPEGKALLLEAYQNASSFDTNRLHGDMKKSRLLSSVANALSDYAAEK